MPNINGGISFNLNRDFSEEIASIARATIARASTTIPGAVSPVSRLAGLQAESGDHLNDLILQAPEVSGGIGLRTLGTDNRDTVSINRRLFNPFIDSYRQELEGMTPTEATHDEALPNLVRRWNGLSLTQRREDTGLQQIIEDRVLTALQECTLLV